MKKLFLRILPFALIMFTLITFIACNDRSENDDTSTDITVTVPGSGGNDDQAQENGNGGEDKGDPDFEYVLLSDRTYGIGKLLNTVATEITVPEYYNDEPVTKIMSGAFTDASELTILTIKSNIQEIEKGALSGCSSLKEITLPFIGTSQSASDPLGFIFGTVSYSGAQKAAQNFKVSNGTERYDNFYIPSGLKKVTVTSGVIHTYAFMDCKMIKEIVFEDGVTAIEGSAFYFCDGLESVSIGKGIAELSDECFRSLTGLKSVSIGENVTKIGYSAFGGCTSLKSIVIPKKVTVIEKYAFDGCTGMESIIFECTSGWYRDYGSASGTGMNVTNPALNVKNLTDSREYSSDRWKRR